MYINVFGCALFLVFVESTSSCAGRELAKRRLCIYAQSEHMQMSCKYASTGTWHSQKTRERERALEREREREKKKKSGMD